ncbi:hypothetical protein GJ496_002744 [Pomphorhynchus laevis]|nr:hypothetical protein GJ496_002744 [Pomphorhynchus laevis]
MAVSNISKYNLFGTPRFRSKLTYGQSPVKRVHKYRRSLLLKQSSPGKHRRHSKNAQLLFSRNAMKINPSNIHETKVSPIYDITTTGGDYTELVKRHDFSKLVYSECTIEIDLDNARQGSGESGDRVKKCRQNVVNETQININEHKNKKDANSSGELYETLILYSIGTITFTVIAVMIGGTLYLHLI